MAKKNLSIIQAGGWIKDARGKSVRLLDPYDLKLLRRDEVIPAELLSKILAEFDIKTMRRARIALIGLLFVPLLVIGHEVLQWVHGRRFGLFNPEMLGVYVALLLLLNMWRQMKRRRLRRACEILLRHIRCAHCGYDIHGLPVSCEDGATVCPECGCAWMLDDVDASKRGDSDG